MMYTERSKIKDFPLLSSNTMIKIKCRDLKFRNKKFIVM